MNCKINCSFAKVIDKLSILKLKLQNVAFAAQHQNICIEIKTIENEYPLSKNKDGLFIFLFNINGQLWDLKDRIGNKAHLEQFDKEYIQYTIDFQRISGLRIQIKNKINIKYSNYTTMNGGEYIDGAAQSLLEFAKNEYSIGNYDSANSKIQILIHKYGHTGIKNQFIADLYASYLNICSILNIDNAFCHKLGEIINRPAEYNLSSTFLEFAYITQCGNLLQKKQYVSAEKYMTHYNNISNLGIDMSFFRAGDTGKTLFIYYMGGIGDSIMLGRIVMELCNKYKNNNIKWLVEFKPVSWIFDTVFKSVSNLTILYNCQKNTIGHFDYHCNLLKVYCYLNYKTYESIPFTPYLDSIPVQTAPKHACIINTLSASNKKTYIFNWHGNKLNAHEKNNRKMELENAIPLFKLQNINWIITSKEITDEENSILNAFDNVFILKHEIENYDSTKAFYDTMVIFKYVDGVISTDTSLVHLSLSMNIPTYVLLTIGTGWLWCRNCERTNWYPEAILIRQKKVRNWDSVINEVLNTVCSSTF